MKGLKFRNRCIKSILLIGVLLLASCGKIQEGPTQDMLDYWAITDYLAERNIEATAHSSGLQFVFSDRGAGISPIPGDTVMVSYSIFRLDGTLWETTDEGMARSNGIYMPHKVYEPFVYVLGHGITFTGFETATELLTEEASGVFYLPSKLGYGPRGMGTLAPHTNLILELELLEVRH